MIRFGTLLLTILALCLSLPALARCDTPRSDSVIRALESLRLTSGDPTPRQALLVVQDKTAYALLQFEKRDAGWTEIRPAMTATIGRNGFAPPLEKREGDGRTPVGVYRLGHAFGYAGTGVGRMPYRQAGPDDLWVDDPDAPDYNRWVKKDDTTAASYERMRRDDNQYEFGLVIEYNTSPVVPNHGSAIFLHVWKDTGAPTAGCVAVSRPDMLTLLNWLEPDADPVIVLNP